MQRTTPAARRRRTSPASRPTIFLHTDGLDLATLLARAHRDSARRVYLVGQRPGGDAAGFTSWALASLPPSWQPDTAGHYLADTSRPVLRYVHDDGHQVEVLRVAAWIGEGDYTRTQASDALALLLEQLRTEWADPSIELRTSPATTGRDLFQRSIPFGVSYPTVDPEVGQLLRSTSGQGRWQHFGPPTAGATVPRVVGYDMRFGYAGLVGAVGVGPAEHHDGDRFTGREYEPGWYRVRFTAPDDWRHIGLLGVRTDDGWRYPTRGAHETWAHGAELHLATRHGWSFEVVESICWERGRPLETWRDKLVAVRDRLAGLVRAGEVDVATATLAAGAARMLVLHTIGAFHGSAHRVTHQVAAGGPFGTDAPDAWPHDDVVQPELRDGWWIYQRDAGAGWSEMVHPEWSVSVFAKCRVRLLDFAPKGRTPTGALHLDPGRLIALRQDALYATTDPGWNTDGDVPVGHLRRVTDLAGPLPWPATARELDQLRKEPEQHQPRRNAGDASTRDGCEACNSDDTTHYPPDGTRWCAGCFPGWDAYPSSHATATPRQLQRQ